MSDPAANKAVLEDLYRRWHDSKGGALEELIGLFDKASEALLKLVGIEPVHDKEHSATARDLEHIVAESGETGELSPELSRLLDRMLDFPGQRRAVLELCMFAEGSRYQEEISIVGPRGKLECKVPGPTRFWAHDHLGAPPVAQLVVSPRQPPGPRALEIPVDAALLAAGDHNGSTYYQHRRFFDLVRGVAGQPVEVGLDDGLKAVLIGLAAEQSARAGQAVSLCEGPYRL